jgi:hypothetical protein
MAYNWLSIKNVAAGEADRDEAAFASAEEAPSWPV